MLNIQKKLIWVILTWFWKSLSHMSDTGFAIVVTNEDTVVEGFDAKVGGIDGANLTVVTAVGCFGWLWGFATQGNRTVNGVTVPRGTIDGFPPEIPE